MADDATTYTARVAKVENHQKTVHDGTFNTREEAHAWVKQHADFKYRVISSGRSWADAGNEVVKSHSYRAHLERNGGK